LVNGSNAIDPQVGDIRMEYQVFSPNFVIAFVSMGDDVPSIKYVIFTEGPYDFIHSKFVKFIIFIIFIAHGNIIFFTWLFLIGNVKKYSKQFVLRFIPLINEYLVYGSKYYISLFFTFLSISCLLGLEVFLCVTLLLACAAHRDRYSM
jgi:hypothetical protein